jgi:2-hydroxychromene-2-carboxylate isomerase
VARVEFFFDYSCPYAYLASTQVEALAARTGAELVYKPFLLGGVFKALGDGNGELPFQSPARARMNGLDMQRWAEHWHVPLEMPSGHPNRTVLALRATLAAGDIARASRALFDAYWARALDVSDPEVVRSALAAAGFDAEKILARAVEPEIKNELRDRTDEALARGVFGAPAFFVGDQLFWGQDRLDWVAEALGGAAEAVRAPRGGKRVGEFEFWYDFSSPFAYLASTRVEALAGRAGARIVWRPFLLGALFKNIGTANVPLLSFSQPKQRYYGLELERFATRYRVPFRFSSHFPLRSVLPLRVALAAGSKIGELSHALFRATWQEDRDVADADTIREICRENGVDASLVDAASSEENKRSLFANTERAVELGLCGAPSFVVDDVVYWGQDRLDFVERALAGWRPRCG